MNVLFNGFDTQEVTFKTSSTVIPKRAVALQSSGDVYYPSAGGEFTGICSSYRNGLATVIMRGYAVVGYKGNTPTVGISKFSLSTMGLFELDDTNGKAYTVVGVDPVLKTIEIIL